MATFRPGLGPSVITNLHISMSSFRNASRVLKETKTIVEAGLADEVVVAALHEHGLALAEVLGPSRRLVRMPLRTRHWPKNILAQLVKYLEFAYRVLALARSCNANIVNVHSVALLPIGVLIKFLIGSKLVYDAHELETEVHGRAGIRKAMSKLVERICIGFADLTIVVSPGIQAWYVEHYGLKAIVTILNTPNWAPVKRTELLRQRLGIPATQKILLYQGGLSNGRGVGKLLEAAPALRAAGYAMVFMGYGELQTKIEAAAARGNTGVYFHPAVPPGELIPYTASADVGVSSIEDSCLSYHLCLPNKLFEYIMAGLPVVVSKLPEMDHVVTTNGIGVSLDNWDATSLLAALGQIDMMRGADLDGRLAHAAQNYCWERQESILVEAYTRHLPGRPSKDLATL